MEVEDTVSMQSEPTLAQQVLCGLDSTGEVQVQFMFKPGVREEKMIPVCGH